MVDTDHLCLHFVFILALIVSNIYGNDILGCGGFVKSHVALDFSKIEIGLYTKSGSLKERTECAPTNGYYFLPLYEKGEYTLKVHPPPGWSFEPSQVELSVDGATDACSSGQDINFAFNGFGITGTVITAGQKQGPMGVSVQLINDKGDKRDTVTGPGGGFHFTPVIPGKYTVKASHPKWKLDPAQAVVQVTEGNTALPVGVLAVKGYEVKGTVTAFGSPMPGVYILLYSEEESPKHRVEGCNTALLQGVRDAPICHVITHPSGEFTFGLVPAGKYTLMALNTNPGQIAVSYNVKPDAVPFEVKHDVLFIKNAFEVTGFTVVGSVLSHKGGAGMAGARVLLDNKPAGNTDSAGKFTLPALQPGTRTIRVQHEQSEFDEVQLQVTSTGPTSVPQLTAARWRVCGSVSPQPRPVVIEGTTVNVDGKGKWCTFLAPGTYNARVEVTEAEQSEGLQFYPLVHKISVGHAAVDGVAFSQLKAKVTGYVQCKEPRVCIGLPVTLRPLSADGTYVGQPNTTVVKDGKYTFEGVLPGSVEISVPSDLICWQEPRHNVAVTQETATVPTFEHTGYVIKIQSTHEAEIEYTSKNLRGVLRAAVGASSHCVPDSATYQLVPKGCHKFSPSTVSVQVAEHRQMLVYFEASSHAVVVRVISPEPVTDLMLKISMDKAEDVGPIAPTKLPSGGYQFKHTLYMTDGEIAVVSAQSSSLIFMPSDPQQVIGKRDCQPEAITLRAVKGLTLKGNLKPPVEGVVITLEAEDLKQSYTSKSDGAYSFGPLDASKSYKISAEKESYTFHGPDDNGDIVAHKLAEITVLLVDDADNTQLQGALVSVSGGSYRRNAASGNDGRLRFPALAPNDYYVKPHMKEYRFQPPHTTVKVLEGRTHDVVLRGVRVAWSCVGTLLSVGGVGWSGVNVVLTTTAESKANSCANEEATTEQNGVFRIRGLLPSCVYTIELKQAADDMNTLKLVKAPPAIEIKNNTDIENVRLIAIQPHQVTDANVLVRTSNIDHYKSLRLTLALESTPHSAIYSTKLDPTGYNQYNNPGLMYVLPRLPADNKSYVLQLESSLSKVTHNYKDEAFYFNSDGKFKYFNVEFEPKVKSSEQELRQTSLLFIPLLALLFLAYTRREQLVQHVVTFVENAGRNNKVNKVRNDRDKDILDKASIDHIVNTVNAAGKRAKKKTV